MGIYLYLAAPPEHAPAQGLTGIDGNAVQALEQEHLVYWYSEVDARPEASVRAVREHNAVVEAALTELITPVPLRFGQWLPDLRQVAERVGPMREAHTHALQRFAGALEFGLRVLDPQEAKQARDVQSSPVTSGREYLLALQQQRRALAIPAAADPLRARVTESMATIAREERIEALGTTHGLLSAAHLVPRDQFEEYRKRTRALREEFGRLRFLVSGPWPPYSFAA